MKKFMLTMGLAAITAITTAQDLTFNTWGEVQVTDEFGDPTGESVSRAFFEGSFSNSATSNSSLIVKMVDYGDAIIMELYEYSRAPGARMCYDGCFGLISVKHENGEVKNYRAFAPKSGGLYFNDKTKFYELINNGNNETLKLVIRESNFDDYGSSSYIFEIITQ